MNGSYCSSRDAAKSREKLGKDLINQSRALLFSVRMIVGIIGVSGRALHDKSSEDYGQFKICLSETSQYSKLLADVRKSLSDLDDEIIAFLRKVNYEGANGTDGPDSKVADHVQSLNELHVILNQSISMLSRLE